MTGIVRTRAKQSWRKNKVAGRRRYSKCMCRYLRRNLFKQRVR